MPSIKVDAMHDFNAVSTGQEQCSTSRCNAVGIGSYLRRNSTGHGTGARGQQRTSVMRKKLPWVLVKLSKKKRFCPARSSWLPASVVVSSEAGSPRDPKGFDTKGIDTCNKKNKLLQCAMLSLPSRLCWHHASPVRIPNSLQEG